MLMKTRYLPYLLLFLFCCCNKGQTSNSLPKKDFKYIVSYDSVITVTANSTFNFPFTIDVTSGDISQNHLNCSISGLPDSAKVSPAGITVSFLKSGVFLFTIGKMAPGTYSVLFIINSAAYGDEVHPLWLNVVLPKDYAPLLAGTYAGSNDYCTPPAGTYNYTSVVTADSAYRLKITNIRHLGSTFAVKAYVSNNIRIPVQTVDTFKIWGSGTYTNTSSGQYMMTINDTLVTGLDTQRCVVHIQH
jgi:hypothetical protein